MFIKLEIFRYKSAYIFTNAVFCLLIEFEKKKKKKWPVKALNFVFSLTLSLL